MHYHYRPDVVKDHEWAAKVTKAHITAVPGLTVLILLVMAISLYLLELSSSMVFADPLRVFSGFFVGEVGSLLLSIPLVTAAALAHSTIVLGKMVDDYSTAKK